MPTGATPERLGALKERVASSRTSSRWLILTHDNPDPDALAAAAGMALLLRRAFQRTATVAYGGIIGRAENREMVRCLNFDPLPLRDIRTENFQHFILADCQPWTGNTQLPKGVVPEVVIDHHPLRLSTTTLPFVDVRPDYGATATIVAEYLLAASVEIPKKLATGFIYAILSETRSFSREASEPDHSIFDRLLPVSDRRALSRIQNARLPLSYFRILHRGLARLQGTANLVVSHLGPVDQPDIVPEIADLLLRLEGRTWSLCTGQFENRFYLSIRTTNPRADAGNLIQRLIGQRGKGGGHGTMAGGFIPLDQSPGWSAEVLERRLTRRFALVLGKSPERIQPLNIAPKFAEPRPEKPDTGSAGANATNAKRESGSVR
jgi:nanoRNase/pAp phosphatase (c-di-AMP/oligoRNAs hydrolase)